MMTRSWDIWAPVAEAMLMVTVCLATKAVERQIAGVLVSVRGRSRVIKRLLDNGNPFIFDHLQTETGLL